MYDPIKPTAAADANADTMHIDQPLIDNNSNPTVINVPPESPSTVSKDVATNQKTQSTSVFDRFFGVKQAASFEFYQALLCEFLGTLLLTIVATGTGLPIAQRSIPDLHGALASGLIVATVIVGFGYISGAHINPAVTVTFLATGETDFFKGLCYIGVQLLGAVCASLLVYSITPVDARGSLGMTMITNGVTITQAFVVEFIITFILCYTVHAICDQNRNDVGGSKALAVGFAVTIGCLFGGPYTGGSMNPARSFGPAWAKGEWKHHWVYWFGPLAGSITAALIYTILLKKSKPAVGHSQLSSSTNRSKNASKQKL